MALLRRGKERFEIFCAPCHGFEGDGNGAIVRRGFPHPPSYYEPLLMAAPGKLFFDTITNGFGVMYSYASRITPHDRWAIVAYIRALQQSRSMQIAKAPELEKAAPRGEDFDDASRPSETIPAPNWLLLAALAAAILIAAGAALSPREVAAGGLVGFVF